MSSPYLDPYKFNSSDISRLYHFIPFVRFRQYGLWERYGQIYPNQDLVFVIGKSQYHKDWYFCQNTRFISITVNHFCINRKKILKSFLYVFMHQCRYANNTFVGTTWEIKFQLQKTTKPGNYTLRLALATADYAELQVRVNDAKNYIFSSKLIGDENAIARHGIKGLYRLYSVELAGSLLVNGDNSIFLTQTRKGIFVGLMYDYIRLEGPPGS